ncbi:hypothetical protein UA75_02420 [Actinoalloteichus sp. GBA129-24]|uniref:Uncharacterized protein n=1 Tax=Actinoalloteichus fjordicus TaxID=1612552 RepID=A0AAC9L912_9PSEU|nr:hypothetical protein UA74_02415 [Actinoalloteichus fjordicus]APU18523.1 hypothetical protein UA75_02420 [Actinoalloteichus sp. GBA129-24]
MAPVLYLLAAIGVLSVAVLLWRAFASERVGVSRPRQSGPVAPDDDPDFLRRLDQQQWEDRMRKQRGSDQDEGNPPA